MNRLTVVKLGGSHAFAGHLPRWIAALEAVAGRVAVVPGGGPFADAVRNAQPRMGFSDAAAHVMAMLAMEQYAHAVADIGNRFDIVHSLAALSRVLSRARVPVWSPLPMAVRDPSVPRSWNVTSDSLALWLAHKLKAHRLLLVKHIIPGPGRSAPEHLSVDGIVDLAFPAMYSERAGGNWICGPEGFESLKAFTGGEPAGMIRICVK